MADVSIRSRSTSTTPAPLVPSPRGVGRTISPSLEAGSSQQSEKWANVLFAFHAEYPDELTIDVCTHIFCTMPLDLLLFNFLETGLYKNRGDRYKQTRMVVG